MNTSSGVSAVPCFAADQPSAQVPQAGSVGVVVSQNTGSNGTVVPELSDSSGSLPPPGVILPGAAPGESAVVAAARAPAGDGTGFRA